MPKLPGRITIMQTYGFIVQTRNASDESLVDVVYGLCEDASASSRDGMLSIAFDREADSMDAALRSAIEQLRIAGCVIDHITIESDSLAALS